MKQPCPISYANLDTSEVDQVMQLSSDPVAFWLSALRAITDKAPLPAIAAFALLAREAEPESILAEICDDIINFCFDEQKVARCQIRAALSDGLLMHKDIEGYLARKYLEVYP